MPFDLARLSVAEAIALGARVRSGRSVDRGIELVAEALGPELSLIALYRADAVIAERGIMRAPPRPSGTIVARAGELALVLVLATAVSPPVARALEALCACLAIACGEPGAAEAMIAAADANAIASAAERDAMVDEAAALRRSSEASVREHAERTRRGQRAMLNVIEDLRDARDRLEERVVERTAELQASNEELEQFAYIASHDLQEPLRTISGYLQLIEQRYAAALDQDAHEFIRFAVDGAQRMQQLIEALLAYSRVARRELVMTEVALDDVLDEVLRALDQAVRDARAEIARDPLPVVRGDRIQLGQLLQNLVGNALKFRGDAPARVEIRAERLAEGHRISVRDHGIGFDNRYADRVFAVFRRLQRKYPGTGIGLAICKKIAELHHGTIRATAAPGQGATFEVILPGGP